MRWVVIAYVPVVHFGYLSMLEKYVQQHGSENGTVLLLDSSLFPDSRPLAKDLRALDSQLIQKQLQVWNSQLTIDVLKTAQSIKHWEGKFSSFDKIIAPDEELTHTLFDSFFSDIKSLVHFDPIFLRWDASRSRSRKDAHPAKHITRDTFFRTCMNVAHNEAAQSLDWWRQVGAAVVLSNQKEPSIVTHNTHLPYDQQPYVDGDPRADFSSGVCIEFASSIHAEALLVAIAARKGMSLEGASLFVTTFPCPVCARLIAKTGVKKVFYSEGYSLLKGQEILEHEGIEVIQVLEK